MKPQELVLALRAMGLTQKQIQKRTGVPQPTISKIGRGDVGDVMSRTYLALLAAYDQRIREEAENPTRRRKRPAKEPAASPPPDNPPPDAGSHG